jgi:hypothetical protein
MPKSAALCADGTAFRKACFVMYIHKFQKPGKESSHRNYPGKNLSKSDLYKSERRRQIRNGFSGLRMEGWDIGIMESRVTGIQPLFQG